MQTRTFAAVIIAILLALSEGAAIAQGVIRSAREYFYGKELGRDAKNWIRLVLLTPRSSDLPIVLFAPQDFKVSDPQRLFRLPTDDYHALASYSQKYRCAANSGHYLPSQALELANYSSGREKIICRMNYRAACRYLDGIRSLPNFSRNEEVGRALEMTERPLHCENINSAAQPPRQ